jgi:hypothetical protein
LEVRYRKSRPAWSKRLRKAGLGSWPPLVEVLGRDGAWRLRWPISRLQLVTMFQDLGRLLSARSAVGTDHSCLFLLPHPRSFFRPLTDLEDSCIALLHDQRFYAFSSRLLCLLTFAIALVSEKPLTRYVQISSSRTQYNSVVPTHTLEK